MGRDRSFTSILDALLPDPPITGWGILISPCLTSCKCSLWAGVVTKQNSCMSVLSCGKACGSPIFFEHGLRAQ